MSGCWDYGTKIGISLYPPEHDSIWDEPQSDDEEDYEGDDDDGDIILSEADFPKVHAGSEIKDAIESALGRHLPISVSGSNTTLIDLRSALGSWVIGAQRNDETIPKQLAYILNGDLTQLRKSKLSEKGRQGKDARNVAHLQILCEELGLQISLADLEYCESWDIEPDRSNSTEQNELKWKNSRDTSRIQDDDSVDTTGMTVSDTSLKLTAVMKLGSASERIRGLRQLPLDMGDLIPAYPFEGKKPDFAQEEDVGYTDLQCRYFRSAILLWPKRLDMDVRLSIGQVSYAIKFLRNSKSDTMTSADRKAVKYALTYAHMFEQDDKKLLMDSAIRWNDWDTWKDAFEWSKFTADGVSKAWQKFSFATIRASLESRLLKSLSFCKRLDALESFRALAPAGDQEAVSEWCIEMTTSALSSMKKLEVEDALPLVSAVCERGVAFLAETILPQLMSCPDKCDFWIKFALALYENRTEIIGKSSTNPCVESNSSLAVFENLIVQCLVTANKQWQIERPRGIKDGAFADMKVKRIMQLVDVCCKTGHPETCETLFALLTSADDKLWSEFERVLQPVIPLSLQYLKTLNVDVCSKPFGNFFHMLISRYLHYVLGSKSPAIGLIKVRKLGCGDERCHDCKSLDEFMWSPRAVCEFKLRPNTRGHVEERLIRAGDLVTFRGFDSKRRKNVVEVSMKEHVQDAYQWPDKQAKAQGFLRIFAIGSGNPDNVARIMGERFHDVDRAVKGVELFQIKPLDMEGSQTTISNSSINGVTLEADSRPAVSVGIKRKAAAMIDELEEGELEPDSPNHKPWNGGT